MNEHTIAGIGISTAGIVDINKGYCVSIDNDVIAFGEKWNGSKRERELYYAHHWNRSWGAIFIDGELYRGHSFSAGEWGIC